MPTYMASATGAYTYSGLEPSTDEILAALNRTFPPAQSTFIGPSPRITRTGTDLGLLLGPFGALDTIPTIHIAWPFTLPDDSTDPATVAQTVVPAMSNALNGLSSLNGHWTATVVPYDPSLNGDLSWWQSGQAALTTSRDEAPTAGGPNTASESPVGPTSTPSLLQSLNPFAPTTPGGPSPVSALTNLLLVGGVVGGTGLAIYYAWPWIAGSRRTAARRSVARKNPRRFKRSKRRRSSLAK